MPGIGIGLGLGMGRGAVARRPKLLTLDFTNAESDFSALTFTGSADTVTDHNGVSQATKANELRLMGLRRIENLYQYSRLTGTGGSAPTGHSQPGGTGSSVEQTSDVSDGHPDAKAWLHTAVSQRPFFQSLGWNIAVGVGEVFTFSLDIEATDTALAANQLIGFASSPAGSTATILGTIVAGQRCHGKLTVGATAGTFSPRIGIGAGSNSTAVVKFSRPMIVRGDYMGEEKWVDYETTYANSKVSAVRYFSTDESENEIDPATVDGMKVISGDTLNLDIADGSYLVKVTYDDLSTENIAKSAASGAGIDMVYADFTRPLIRKLEVFPA